MKNGWISGKQLRDSGWTAAEVRSALDAPDDREPSKHWLNPHGQPLYDVGRVAVAAYRIGRATRRPPADVWEKWRESERPTSKPLYSLSFQRIAQALDPDSANEIRALRIAHPRWGRVPGTQEPERDLKRALVVRLVERVTERRRLSWGDTEQALTDRAAAIELTVAPYPTAAVALRLIRVSGYVSRAVSARAIARAFDFLALIHAGHITAFDHGQRELVPLLVEWSTMRLDVCALEAARSPSVKLGF